MRVVARGGRFIQSSRSVAGYSILSLGHPTCAHDRPSPLHSLISFLSATGRSLRVLPLEVLN